MRDLVKMCFSPTASFSTSALLGAISVASFAKAENSSQKVLAGIPLVFCIQQFTEGALWLSLLHSVWQPSQDTFTHLFLLFAQAVWPVYMPVAALLLEKDRSKRRLVFSTLLCGIALSSYIIYALCRYPEYAVVESHHIRYVQHFALAQQWFYGLLYFFPTIASLIISSKKELRWLGYLFFASYVAARLWFHFYEISIWCFFGAIISFTIFFMVHNTTRPRWWKL